MPFIDVKNLNRSFGHKSILKDVSLQIDKRSVYGLVGLNGSGKTTLIRILLGLLNKDGGSVSVGGYDPWKHQTEYYRKTGVVLENDGFFGNLSVMDNLKIFASAKGVSWKEAQKYFEDYWGGTEIFAASRKVKFLSRGQKVQCGLCRAFLGWPQVCFFDEPAVSLDIKAYEHFKLISKEAVSRGAVQLISSHQLETIDELCDRAGLLKDGQLEELDKKAGLEAWVIRVLNSGEWGKIVSGSGGSNIAVDGGVINFSVNGSQKCIPQIVKNLALAGCDICEVRQVKPGFSDTIKNIYKTEI
ncbi:MAG: ABC transporter ATP-binding protein [Chitinispirillales bacterium]|jgi:ABC-type multidrug transport system ATPase subunit|nr:ABC transporter ATP-binding protein [Chitinispirillales bacterium]